MSTTGIPNSKNQASDMDNSVASSANPRPHNTGFEEPLSRERNTQLPHPDRIIGGDTLDITDKLDATKKRRIPKPRIHHHKKGDKAHTMTEEEMKAIDDPRAGLEAVGEEEEARLKGEGKKGKVKHVLKKAACQE